MLRIFPPNKIQQKLRVSGNGAKNKKIQFSWAAKKMSASGNPFNSKQGNRTSFHFVWGPPPKYGRPVYLEERKVRYVITDESVKIEDLVKELRNDIMPSRLNWCCCCCIPFPRPCKRDVKIFDTTGYRITNASLLENGKTYYVDIYFPRKTNIEDDIDIFTRNIPRTRPNN